MVSPSDPEQKGSSEVLQDGMSNADHEAELNHAGGGDRESDSDKDDM
jgi:hypothetical protein